MALSTQKLGLVAVLALSPLAALAGDCPPGAAPFPSNMSNSGRQQYANLFDISYYNTYKVIHYSDTLGNYTSNHPKANERIPDIVLYQCGTTQPSFGSPGIDDAFARYFEIPIQKATLPWSGPLPHFELLSTTETIYAMDFSDVSSACAQLMEECVPSLHITRFDEDYATIAANNSVVFTGPLAIGFTNTDWDVEYQVTFDPAFLIRAEWINFVAAFFNLEAQSNEIFSKIDADYLAMKGYAQQLGQDSSTEWGGRQPLVLWATAFGPTTCPNEAEDCVRANGDALWGWWTQVGGSWCQCGGWAADADPYMKNLVEDAGGRLVPFPQTTPSGCVMSSNTNGSVS